MFELIVLLVGAMPFLVGLYALRKIKRIDDEGSDDQPPPPDPDPPRPVLPPAPKLKRVHRPVLSPRDRTPIVNSRVRTPSWRRTVPH